MPRARSSQSQHLQSQSPNSSSPPPPPSLSPPSCSSPAITERQTKQAVAGSALCFEYFNPIRSIEQSPAPSPIPTPSIEQSPLPPSQDLSARELKAAASARGGVRGRRLT